ncbi:MAG: hypothetical protein HQL92_08075 [Magnetococcales bacterium]|nr:hypothetical protein [Magnetococcales bacterium]
MALVGKDPEPGMALTDAGYWSEDGDGLTTVDCELLIVTHKDWKQLR